MRHPARMLFLLWASAAPAQTLDTVWHHMMGGTADDLVRHVLVREDGSMFIYQAPANPRPDEGIAPDHHVPTTAQHIAQGRDPQVEFIMKRLLR